MTKEDLHTTIIAHLGSGSSPCVIKNVLSTTSAMCFNVLEGVMMGTRTGNIDPGVVLYLIDHEKMTTKQIIGLLYKKS